MKYDAVIIGSGLGGLLSAAMLSKEGMQVLVLEKNAVIGGCLQTFTRKGHLFDTGVHYIGSMGKGEILNMLFRYFGLAQKLPLKRLDEDCFDKIIYKGESYAYAQGYDNFIDKLSQKFPQSRTEIRTYVNNIKKISASVDFDHMQIFSQQTLMSNPYFRYPASDFIDDSTKDPVLRNILAGLNCLYAGVPGVTPAYIHALINAFFIQSAWRIVNGGSSLARLLSDMITENGGEIRKNAEVVALNMGSGKLDHAVLQGGEKVYADRFISNVHPSLTVDLVKGEGLRKPYKNRIKNLDNTIGTFILYLVLREDAFPYLNYNVNYYDRDDVWGTRSYDPERWPDFFLLYTPVTSNQPEFARSLIAITYMKYEEVRKWEHTTIEKRGDDYRSFKEDRAQRLLALMEKVYPGIRNAVESHYSSTPLTLRDYTHTPRGSVYGILQDSRNFMESILSARTKIPNLFLTGQNVNVHGMLGVTLSSLTTCSEILGQEYVLKKLQHAV